MLWCLQGGGDFKCQKELPLCAYVQEGRCGDKGGLFKHCKCKEGYECKDKVKSCIYWHTYTHNQVHAMSRDDISATVNQLYALQTAVNPITRVFINALLFGYRLLKVQPINTLSAYQWKQESQIPILQLARFLCTMFLQGSGIYKCLKA